MNKKKVFIIGGVIIAVLIVIILLFVKCSVDKSQENKNLNVSSAQISQNAALPSQQRGVFTNTENVAAENTSNASTNVVIPIVKIENMSNASAESASKVEQMPQQDSRAIYVLTHVVNYRTDGSVFANVARTYNEQGDMITEQQFVKNMETLADDNNFTITYNDYDENGYYKSTDSTSGEGVAATYEFREDGLAVKKTLARKETPDGATREEAGITEYQYEYYPSGKLKVERSVGRTGYIQTEIYDEDGYKQSSTSENNDGYKNTTTYTLEKDQSEKIIGVTKRYETTVTQPREEHFRIETDANGNIVREYDESGKLRGEYAYALIEHPSKHAYAENGVKYM